MSLSKEANILGHQTFVEKYEYNHHLIGLIEQFYMYGLEKGRGVLKDIFYTQWNMCILIMMVSTSSSSLSHCNPRHLFS